MKAVEKCSGCAKEIKGMVFPETIGRKEGKPVFAYLCQDCHGEIMVLEERRDAISKRRTEIDHEMAHLRDKLRNLDQEDKNLFEENKIVSDKMRDVCYDVAKYKGAVWPAL